MKEELKASYKNILCAIYTLDSEGYLMTTDGLSLLLVGDLRVADLSGSAAFGYLPSLSTKKIKNRINYLIRYSYLNLQYHKEFDIHFLVLSDKGKALKLKKVVKKPSECTKNIYYLKKEK